MKKLLMNLMVILSLAVVFSCGKDDDEMMIIENCTDGIQNGTETGVDCGGDCSPCVTTVEEDKENVQRSFDDLTGCAMEVRDARTFTELFQNFLGMTDGEIMNEEWVNDVTGGLEEVFDFDHVEENSGFDMAFHAGTFVYNANTSSWNKVSDVSDRVVLQFPSNPDATTNNVELVLDRYTDELVTMDGESVSLPTTMHAALTIDGNMAFEISLDNITYSDDSETQLPTSMTASVFMDPINLEIDLSSSSATAYEMGMSIQNSGLCDVSVQTQFELADTDMNTMDMASFNQAAVQINLGRLSFRTMGDLASVLELEDPTDSQINSMVDLDLFFEEFKIADIEINDDMETILLLYKDGSTEEANSLLEDIEEILAEFFG